MQEFAYVPPDPGSTNIMKLARKHNIRSVEELYKKADSDPQWFWPAVIEDCGLSFDVPYSKLFDGRKGIPWTTWFEGGKINITKNCVEKYGTVDSPAIKFEREDGTSGTVSFRELDRLTGKMAGSLLKLGVKKGDRVGIYMPPNPESIISLYSIMRIGAVAVPIFSGYGRDAVSTRLEDAGIKFLFSLSQYSRKGRQVNVRKTLEALKGVHLILIQPEIAAAIRPFVKLIIVDGVASIGGERMNAAQWNIDICLTASQKALGAQAGAGLLVASENAMSLLQNPSISGYLLDLRNWAKIMQNFLAGGGGYFATPPIGTVFSLAESFRRIEVETMEARIARHRTCSEAFRKGITEMGLEVVASEPLRSSTVTGVYLENADIGKFLQEAMTRGVEFAAGVHPEIKERYFRVGHMGWIEPAHIMIALNAIEGALESLGRKVEKDSGKLAAKNVLEKALMA